MLSASHNVRESREDNGPRLHKEVLEEGAGTEGEAGKANKITWQWMLASRFLCLQCLQSARSDRHRWTALHEEASGEGSVKEGGTTEMEKGKGSA